MKRTKVEQFEFNRLVAQVKYGLIAPVVSNTYTDATQRDYFQRISSCEIDWPDGSKRKFSWETIKQWFYAYQHGGIEALQPNVRLDLGTSRRLSEECKTRIKDLIHEFPKITGVMVYEKLISESYITKEEVSLITIQRYIKQSGIRNNSGTIKKEKRAWEYAHALDGYEADTCHTMYIFDENGEYKKTYLIAIIDNHSRMIVGAQFHFNDTAINFQQVWKSALLRYGRSKVMILDNGSSYKNKWNQQISATIGTQLIYNPPHCPTGKAVIERFFRTIKDRWLNCDHGNNYHSLEELNQKLNQWVSEYNRSEHRALENDPYDNHSPFQRFMYDMKDTEPWKTVNKSQLEFYEYIEECFLYEEIRKVNGDSTVLINKISFDVPSQYIGTSIIVRYDSIKYKTVYLFDPANKLKIPLKQTDKVENGKTRRTEVIY